MQRGTRVVLALALAFALPWAARATAQALGIAGTISGTVLDPSGAAVPNAKIEISNPITGYQQSVTSGANGRFSLTNVPFNPYHLEVHASGFAPAHEDVTVRSTVPIDVPVHLVVAGGTTTVNVEAAGPTLIENDPSAHTDVDRNLFSKLPALSPGSSLNDAITYSSPSVAADSNGFFHPLGDHAQTTFVVDGEPISDQQSKLFSTTVPLNALDSMELTTGAPSAEYGDKTSLVVNATTRSGLGKPMSGSLDATYGSFGTVGEDFTLGTGNSLIGNFLVLNAIRSGRFLDSPEFQAFHDVGNNETLFDRIDVQSGTADAFHIDLFAARNWFQIPNTYDQLATHSRTSGRRL